MRRVVVRTAVVLGPGGGALSDWLVRRGWQPAVARRRVMLGAACLMPCSLLAVHAPSAYVALALGTAAGVLAVRFPGGR